MKDIGEEDEKGVENGSKRGELPKIASEKRRSRRVKNIISVA
jgi:hypothetical protein